MTIEAKPDAAPPALIDPSKETVPDGGTVTEEGVAEWHAQLDRQARAASTGAATSRGLGHGRNGSASSVSSSSSRRSSAWEDRSARSSISSASGLSDAGGHLDGLAGRNLARRASFQGELERQETQPFTAAEAEVATSFIHPDHIRAIGQASRHDRTAVTFRAAGEATLRRLGEGAAAKPHAIIEKTVKPSSLTDARGEQDPERLRAMREAELDGFVGHWDGQRLVGLYVAPTASELEASDDPNKRALASMLQPAANGQRFYPIDESRLAESLAPLKEVGDWKCHLFAGDYDMHDLMLLQGRRSQVPSGSRDEAQLIRHMVDSTSLIDPQRPQGKQSHAVIQHGAQHNYVAHMRNEEKVEPLSAKVAGREFPLALCERGNWSIIHSEAEHDALYRRHNMTVKSTWKDNGGVFLQDDGAGTARLRRGSTSSIDPKTSDASSRRGSR